MRRGTLTGSSLALLVAGLAMIATPVSGEEVWTADTHAAGEAALAFSSASLSQEEPPLTVTPLASGQLGRLSNEPLRWVVREFRFPAGYTTPLLVHPPDVFYVMEGVASFTQGGVTMSLGPGSGAFTTGAEHVHLATGNVPSRVLAFTLYPASLPTPRDSATGILLHESALLEGLGDGPYTLALSFVEARQGASAPTHFHTGPTMVYLLEGAIDQTLGGLHTPRRAGDAWLEQPGVISAARFIDRMAIRLLVAQVLPQGDPILIPVD